MEKSSDADFEVIQKLRKFVMDRKVNSLTGEFNKSVVIDGEKIDIVGPPVSDELLNKLTQETSITNNDTEIIYHLSFPLKTLRDSATIVKAIRLLNERGITGIKESYERR